MMSFETKLRIQAASVAVIAVTILIAAATAAPSQEHIMLLDCAPQWRRVIDGKTFCLLGEPYYADHLIEVRPVAPAEREIHCAPGYEGACAERDDGSRPYLRNGAGPR